MHRLLLTFVCGLMLLGRSSRAEPPPADPAFDERVAPVLIRRCIGCHSGADPKGGLDLSRKDAALAGGESGVSIQPGDAEGSLLWQRVRDGDMPPKEALSAEEQQTLEAWIDRGAPWGTDPLDPFRFTTEQRAGYDWWSLQPLQPAPLPRVNNAAWLNDPIDAFVLGRLEQAGLAPSPQADRKTLIRRLSFDLLGLPPSPEAVAAFEADDRPDAYERLVDQLLASPQYGVRWGRAWLDVARFGESQGFERDKLRENAWPYRDWVIDAWNADMAYDEFIRLQLAGDVLRSGDPSAIVATGFLVAGPYDEVGQKQQSAAMRAVVRQDELEDYVSTVGESFLGLTVHCARCHDHKFDPIFQREYYQLAAALEGVTHGERRLAYLEQERRRKHVEAEIAALRRQLGELDHRVRERILSSTDTPAAEPPPTPLARWSFEGNTADALGVLDATLHGGARLESGGLTLNGRGAYAASAPLAKDLRAKTLEAWVRLDDLNQSGGGVLSVQTLDGAVFDAIVFGERDPGQWMAGSDSFRRSQSFAAPPETEAAQRLVHVALVYEEDGTITGYREGQPYGQSYRSSGPVVFAAGKSQVVFGLRHAPPGGNRLLHGAIAAAQLYDRALTAEEVARSAAAGESVTEERLLAAMTVEERAQRDVWAEQLETLTAKLPPLQSQEVYTVASMSPGPSHVLLRGNPATPSEPVKPGGIAALVGVSPEFGLSGEASDAARRMQLAEWIASPQNPLTARVMVNRLWHYHFGVGLVDTPSDFGFSGGRPSHPELLDYLAREFIASDWSIKQLQRKIVISSTYRQASRRQEAAYAQDANNRLLWRKTPQRLDAEALRDAILAAAGELNESLGGPGFRDFTTYVHNTQFYTMQDPIGSEYNRRSVYRTWVRSARSRFLDVFDCPDPSTKTPKRAVTVTPLQALSLLNNVFVLRMSDRMADRVRREAGEDVEQQVERAFQWVYARSPTQEEKQTIAPFVKSHGLSEFCRVLMNSNEFLYVE